MIQKILLPLIWSTILLNTITHSSEIKMDPPESSSAPNTPLPNMGFSDYSPSILFMQSMINLRHKTFLEKQLEEAKKSLSEEERFFLEICERIHQIPDLQKRIHEKKENPQAIWKEIFGDIPLETTIRLNSKVLTISAAIGIFLEKNFPQFAIANLFTKNFPHIPDTKL